MTGTVAESLGGIQASRDESGTAPGDRRFRPDVEGLRAVAIVLVVLYHGGLKVLSGGYIGVDVFFVISGFVITGLLLRERASSGRTSFLSFYARRSRRIIPAATLVIAVTVTATYWALGAVYGDPTAVDGRWTAVFLANFHFASVGTNYLNEQQPPSPLLNFWSLAVEEQFYLVYPALFVLIAALRTRLSLQIRLVVGLVAVIVISFTLSVIQTNSNPAVAFLSPFTRAWELALGALVAVGTQWLLRIPKVAGSIMTWVGLGAIGFCAVAFNANTVYPGSLVAIPVLGAGLVIAGGVTAPRWAAESMLGLSPFRWIGRLSYSLYLWHWPLLIIAAEYAGKASLPFSQNAFWLLLALAAAAGTYALVENPIRHLHTTSKKSVAMGVGAVCLTVVVLSVAISAETAPLGNYTVNPVATTGALLLQVAAATSITKVPKSTPLQVPSDWGGNYEGIECQAAASQWKESICTLGDPTAKRLMVVYGDSHALMWLPAFNSIARSAHWRLVILAKDACPAELVTVANQPAWGRPNGPNLVCDRWHKWALDWINTHKPSLLVITQESLYHTPATSGSPPVFFTFAQWRHGLSALLRAVRVPGIRKVFLGNIPTGQGPTCLAGHIDDVEACSVSAKSAVVPYNRVEQSTVAAHGTEYVNTIPWFCSTQCTAVIGKYPVYRDALHINAPWALYLQNVLSDSIGIHDHVATSTLPVITIGR
jgi:peptidoglycan/LPS O-acetylase OafA/YrhL